VEQPRDKRLLILDKLFQMLDVKKKGISLVYDYLLEHQIIEDLEVVSKSLRLTLKRVYKILAELRDINLCQTIDRPMKISLLDPQAAWERLINIKIQELKDELNEKIGATEKSLEEFFAAYNIQKIQKAPVEFIRYDGFEFVFYAFWGERSLNLANGIKYLNPGLKKIIADYENQHIPDQLLEHLRDAIRKLEVKILISVDALRDSIEEVQTFSKLEIKIRGEVTKLIPRSIEVRVAQESFSNFTLRDDEILMQPAFDPSNRLLGCFLSSQKEIVQIFRDKFDAIFKNAKPLAEFLLTSEEFKNAGVKANTSFVLASL
jgi:hypothetical protein